MRQKRGQAIILILLSLALVVGVIIALVAIGGETRRQVQAESEKTFSIDSQGVRAFTENCARETAHEAAFYLGFVGGRLSPDPFPFYYRVQENYNIPYFFYEDRETIPVPFDKGFWESRLAQYLSQEFGSCVRDYISFPGLEVEHGPLRPKVTLTDTRTLFAYNYPVTVTQQSVVNDLDSQYTIALDIRLKDMLETSTFIVAQMLENSRYIHWDYITEQTQQDFNITAYTEDDNTIIYRLTDLQGELDDEPYILQWAAKIAEGGGEE